MSTEEKKTRKPRRVRTVDKPDSSKSLSKSEITIAAGRYQAKVNAITKNHAKSYNTAMRRVDSKYAELVKEELTGLHPDVLSALELPAFASRDYSEDPEVTVEDEQAAE